MRARRWALVPAALLLVLAGPLGCTSAGADTAGAPAASAESGATGPAANAEPAASAEPGATGPAASAEPVGSGEPVGSAEVVPARPVVAPRGTGLPPGVAEPPAGTGQLVTVLAPGAAATTATLRTWQRDPSGTWRAVRGPIRVRVGTDGVGRASERTRRTPAGMFTLDQAFGRAADPGTKLPYRRVGNQDWWVSDPRSPAYNTYRHCAPGSCPFDESAGENLGRSGPSYDHALVIGYNTARPVAGAGSAFFLHVDAGVPSAGCVVTPRAEVVALLRWLDPARQPRIAIGTG